MSSEPFFSVIIPTLNEERFLPRLLSDLAAQKEKSFEVIVIDGGSEDGTEAIVKKFQTKLTITFLTSSKKNVCYQRNFAVTHAQGRYVVFFDADVQIPLHYLSSLHKYLQRTKVPFLTTRVKADSRHRYDQAIVTLVNMAMDMSQIIERPFVGGYNFIVLKSVFEWIGGFDESVVHAEDYDLAQRLFIAGYKLTILKSPRLTFSLRRFRNEGRIKVLQKNAAATMHVLTKGPITKEIFSYPMGGLWYKFKKREEIRPQVLKQATVQMKRFLRLLTR